MAFVGGLLALVGRLLAPVGGLFALVGRRLARVDGSFLVAKQSFPGVQQRLPGLGHNLILSTRRRGESVMLSVFVHGSLPQCCPTVAPIYGRAEAADETP